MYLIAKPHQYLTFNISMIIELYKMLDFDFCFLWIQFMFYL